MDSPRKSNDKENNLNDSQADVTIFVQDMLDQMVRYRKSNIFLLIWALWLQLESSVVSYNGSVCICMYIYSPNA